MTKTPSARPNSGLLLAMLLALVVAGCGTDRVPTDGAVIERFRKDEAVLRELADLVRKDKPRTFQAADRPSCPPALREAMERVGVKAAIAYSTDPYHVHLAFYFHDHFGPGAQTKGICLLERPPPPEEAELWAAFVEDTDRLEETQFDVHRKISETAAVFHRAND